MGKRALCAGSALTAALCLSGCGEQPEPRAPRGSLTVYLSAPAHGPAARAGHAVLAGARRALRDSDGSAGERRIRLVALSANRRGDADWDPGTVEANARRAADDPRAVAYIGEVDGGGSAVSLPRTNQAGLLQVSPTDGLTSLTRPAPGRPRAGPARYYPSERRTFLRMVPSDLVVSRAMVALARPVRGRRIALVQTADFAQRELGAALAADLRRVGSPPVAGIALSDSADTVPGALDELAEARPDAILVAGRPGPVTTAVLRGVGRRLPSAALVGSPGLTGERLPLAPNALAATAVLPPPAQPPRGRRVLSRLGKDTPPQALYGYDAMRLVLDAVGSEGASRRAVVRSALQPRLARGITGPFRVLRGGDVARSRLAVVSLTDGRAVPRSPER